jgi:SIR2-like domain
MDIKKFISKYKNHPVLFIGTGISLRYITNSFTWDGLLKKIVIDLKGSPEFYFDIKSQCVTDDLFDYPQVASLLEEEFNNTLINDRNGKFKDINNIFYHYMGNNVTLSRLKIYIANILKDFQYKEEMITELKEFKKIRKNIGSIITTNYDLLIENIFEFEPLIGNDILLSNPYGSVYKIHGCVTQPARIIITTDDYNKFHQKYELIRAQLLSLFIHHPIIFMGYNIGDDNIKSLLKTIFTYVEPNSEDAKRIRDNFLLVEHEEGSMNQSITEHDIDLEGFSTIRINKIKTDNFVEIYKCLSNLTLPISAMDIRKVQSIVKDLYSGGNVKVNITENLDSLKNNDKIIVIGSDKTIKYEFQTSSEIMSNYFKIVEESNHQLLKLIDKLNIQSQQYFPIFVFSQICPTLEKSDMLKKQQKEKLTNAMDNISAKLFNKHDNIDEIFSDNTISISNKNNAILWGVLKDEIDLDDVEKFLINHGDKKSTSYRKILCAYDFQKYGGSLQ